ncbi:RsiV family protein [Aquimarina sp. 2-A2]|uniref:RsiV family protein n=1 Tax=Aquimarina sp. 2-A2 TaxID=3382644 RepID=UPI00387F0D95
MKFQPLLLLLSLLFASCKNENQKELIKADNQVTTTEVMKDTFENQHFFSEDKLSPDYNKSQRFKREKLLALEDKKEALKDLVSTKTFSKETDDYILNYRYPYLNEGMNASHKTFNNYIKETYLNIAATENEILEDKALLCDTLNIKRFMDKRTIDYKLFSAKDNLVSVVLYKENYYSGTVHSVYSFDCLNYNTNTSEFMTFNDIFIPNAESEVLTIINHTITQGLASGELYYECWELSPGDFQVYKNNFVINDALITFYFDDCVVCPSYTGTYSIEIPTARFKTLLKKDNILL